MQIGELFKWSLGVIIVGLVLASGVLYVQLSRIPEDYHPAQLTADQKNQAVKEFWNMVQDFGNAIQENQPFDWSVSEDQLNRYIASIDEIASSTPSGRPGAIYRALDDAGLAQPAVALHEGILTFMVRSKEHEKLLAVDVSLSLAEGRNLRVRVVEARVGKVSMPSKWVKNQLEKLRDLIPAEELNSEKAMRPSSGGIGGLSSRDLARAMEAVIAGIEKNPIATELTWPVNNKRVRIESVEVAEGIVRLRVVPLGRRRR